MCISIFRGNSYSVWRHRWRCRCTRPE